MTQAQMSATNNNENLSFLCLSSPVCKMVLIVTAHAPLSCGGLMGRGVLSHPPIVFHFLVTVLFLSAQGGLGREKVTYHELELLASRNGVN